MERTWVPTPWSRHKDPRRSQAIVIFGHCYLLEELKLQSKTTGTQEEDMSVK
jgi:hypothetical protein